MCLLQSACRPLWTAAFAVAVGAVAACHPGVSSIPTPRPLVVYTGARIQPDSARLDSIDHWVQTVTTTIADDPSFLVDVEPVPQEAYPWQTLEIRSDDTVRVGMTRAGEGAVTTYEIYGFLHLMKRVGRMAEFFPEAADLEGYDLERFILARTADAWLLARAVYTTEPYAPLDEIVYAQDRGYLDAMILTARPDDFPDERAAYEKEHPGRIEEYRTWFKETFEREPPGLRGS